MKAPKRESKGNDQERRRYHTPGDAVVTAALLFAFRHPDRHGGQHWCFLRGDLGQAGSAGGHEIGDGLVFVNAQVAGIGADEPFVEDAAGKLVELLLLEGDEETGADLGGDRDVVQRDLALFPLPFQPCPKGFHLAVFLPPSRASGRIKE